MDVGAFACDETQLDGSREIHTHIAIWIGPTKAPGSERGHQSLLFLALAAPTREVADDQ
jgi:hypothetical protein